MITLNSLSKIYRTDEIETVALENVNLTVERGEFLSIMGPSGCGKSTLLNIMGLLDAPTMGMVEINGIRTEGMKDVYKRQADGLFVTLFRFQNHLPAGAAGRNRMVDEVLFRSCRNGKSDNRLVGILGVGIE